MVNVKWYIVMAMLILSVSSMKAQEEPMYRWEIGGGIGAMTYQGDFNGSIMSGKNTSPSFSVMLRRVFNPYTTLRANATYGKLKGSTKVEETYYPDFSTKINQSAGKEYTFNNSLLDLSFAFEYNFWPYGTGRDYRGAKRITPFIFGGLGFTYVKCSNGWKDYSNGNDGNGGDLTASIPIGLGVKYKVAQRVNLGLEWTAHFSLSDKLDGVKDPYRTMSSGMFKNTDCFSVLQATVTYSFGPQCKTCMNSDWTY